MESSRRLRDPNQSSRRIFFRQLAPLISLILCCALLAPFLASTSAGQAGTAQGKGVPQKGQGRRVRPDPPQPGAPAAALPNLDDVRQRLPLVPRTPPPLPSMMRSRRKPLESRRGRRVGDPLPTPTPAVPTPTPVVQGAGGDASPAGFNSSDSFTAAELYAYFPRFLVSPSYDQPQSFSDSVSLTNSSFDFFTLSMLQVGGAKIVFSSNRDGHAQIYLMNSDGSGQQRLTG